jgi:hypothetical protein
VGNRHPSRHNRHYRRRRQRDTATCHRSTEEEQLTKDISITMCVDSSRDHLARPASCYQKTSTLNLQRLTQDPQSTSRPKPTPLPPKPPPMFKLPQPLHLPIILIRRPLATIHVVGTIKAGPIFSIMATTRAVQVGNVCIGRALWL